MIHSYKKCQHLLLCYCRENYWRKYSLVAVLNVHCKRYRATGPHRAGVDVDVTPPTDGPVEHPPNPATLCGRSAQGSKSWHSGSFAKYSDIGLVTISFPACCLSHRATGLPVMVYDMHTRRRRPDYLQACPTGPPVEGVKSALTPALCGPVALYLLQWPV